MTGLRALGPLALNTFREAVRDRVLYAILFFAVGVILLSLALEHVTIGDQNKVVRSVAQGSIDLFGSVIAMFLGVSLVWKEIDRRTVYNILSKPVARPTFIVGKYLGLLLTIAVELALMFAVYAVVMVAFQRFPPPVVLVSIGLLFSELALMCAWATLFSTFTGPTLAAAYTLAVFVIGHLADDVWLYGSRSESPAVRTAARFLYWVLPNFEVFNIRDQAVHEMPIPWDRVLPALAYGGCYSVVVLCIAVAVFQRRDLP